MDQNPRDAGPIDPMTTLKDNQRVTPSAIYRAILQAIRDGSLRPGHRLPNERELASRYGTTRATVRSALSMMDGQGLIRRRVGSGTYLADDADQIFAKLDITPIRSHDDVPSFLEILEGRLLFEPAMLSLVVSRATTEDYEAMEDALARVLAAPTWLDFKEAIYGLHGRMFAATRNRFLIQVFESIVADRRAVRFDGLDTANPVPEPVRRKAYNDLQAIVRALASRDERQADKLMRDHLLRTLATVNVYQ